MKKKFRFFRNIRMPFKLLISFGVILAVGVIGIGGVLYSFIQNQLHTQGGQVAKSAVQLAEDTLGERCNRVQRSLNYFTTDLNIIQIVNEKTYISEYQKAYDVNQILDPAIVNICEQNELIDKIIIYTYGEIGGARIGYVSIDDETNSPFITQKDTPVWVYYDGEIGVSRGIVNLWNPEQTATAVAMIDMDNIFAGLLPNIEYDCELMVYDSDGGVLYSEQKITDIEKWNKDKNHQIYTGEALVNGWKVTMECCDIALSDASAQVYRNLIAVAAVVFIIMAAVGIFLSVRISSRVTKLCKQVERVVEDDYKTDIHSEDEDEIGKISNSVGEMVAKTRIMIREKYQSEIDSNNAKIQALQAQINPHFLYNTLSNLNWRAIAINDIDMSNILTDLSQFYRLSLNGGNTLATIGQEIEHIKTYVRIQCAIRHTQLAEESYDVDEEVMDFKMPGIILQPIVENALGHGIGAIGYENGRLRVSVVLNDERIIIKISDNGPGIPEDVASQIFEEGSKTGYGLRNVKQRLALMFGEESKMYFDKSAEGSTVVLELPMINKDQI